MKKRNILVLLLACVTTFCFGFSSCKENVSSDSDSDTHAHADANNDLLCDGCGETLSDYEEKSLVLDKKSLSLTLGETYQLHAKLGEEIVACSWQSSAEDIATVDEFGNISTYKLGKATLTAKSGNQRATCVVDVVLNDNIPVLRLSNIPDEDVVRVNMEQAVDFSGEVVFNGNVYEDVTTSVEISDPSMGTLENGRFIPAKKGEVTATVRGVWRGIESPMLTKTITITVVPTAKLLINDSPVFVDMQIDLTGGQTTIPFKVSLVIDGVEAQSSNLIRVADAKVAAFDKASNTIIVKGVGSTVVKIAYLTDDDYLFEREVQLTVI